MELDRKETLTSPRTKGHYLRWAGGAAALAIGMTTAAIYTAPDDSADKRAPQPAESPIDQYRHNFTDDDRCLDGTIYDEEKGANVTLESVNGGEVVRVVPETADAYSPAVLYITQIDKGWFGFGDNQTGAYLFERKCENIPNGY